MSEIIEQMEESSERERPRGVAVFAPTPLLTLTVEQSVTQSEQLHIHLGGQGVWVARMVARLGVPVILCGPFGGETGKVAQHLSSGDTDITFRPVESAAWNGAYVHDRRSGDRRILADVAADPLSRHELDDLYSVTLAAALESGVCVLTGTHQHPVVDDEVYRRLASDLHAHGVQVVADLSGGPFTSALEGGLTLVKISDEELLRDGWITEPTGEQIDNAIGRLRDAGAEHVIVSRGDAEWRASIGGVEYQVRTPTMEAVDHRGAGDAMTGALAVGLARGFAADELLRTAAAAGAATVVRHGFATGTREAVSALAELVEVVSDER